MSHIYLCFVWHMHQPFYKDLITGEYRLPWTRMHALKDYFGMVQVLADFPAVHQTFNLVPSLLSQIEEYAGGKASDRFFNAALKPSEDLTDGEQEFLLQYSFQATTRLIGRFPRYQELFEQWQGSGRNAARARRMFGAQSFRDLQVLSQLAWFDEEFLAHDEAVRELVQKGRAFSREDQALIGRKELEIVARVLPAYREFAARGQVELSTTPFYHPILPLICDSNIATVSHPYVPLPPRFSWPEDARWQLHSARVYMTDRFGSPPAGLWPSEGSVSDEALGLAAQSGFKWTASDNGVLARSIGEEATPERSYQPWLWSKGGRQIHALFRDHYLSDLIGFVYSKMGAREAAQDFISRIRANVRPLLDARRDALVPVILDGENAWEYYEQNGRPFLRELYGLITEAKDMTAVTVSEALDRVPAAPMNHIFPGSWINANFDVWIGAEEDNKAWELLLDARQAYDRVANAEASGIREEDRKLAWEELMIAEGSDWCWWYGPEHGSENRPEFDQLYRQHLANAYRALGVPSPEALSRPILKSEQRGFDQAPTAPLQPTIDGRVTSYFEWMGAGRYRPDTRSGAMHGKRLLAREVMYGSDGRNLFVRVDFEEEVKDYEVRIGVRPQSGDAVQFRATVAAGQVQFAPSASHPSAAADSIFEFALPLSDAAIAPGQRVAFQLSIWREDLPLDAIPQQGWIEFSTADPSG